jgi:phage shock protein PspC (stress-responsive transcriptional regulator)
MNIGVDYLTLELSKELKYYNVDTTIIRLGSLLTENVKFNAKVLKLYFIDNFYNNTKETNI